MNDCETVIKTVSAGSQPSPQPADAPARGLILWQETLAAALAIAGFLAALALISQSTGFYHDDDICHYNLVVEGWTNPQKAWHSWGRPGYTLPTMPFAHFWGMAGCRVFSALQMMIVAYLAFRIARLIMPPTLPGRAGRFAAIAPALAPLLVWAEPLTIQLSLTTLTEIPAALYLTLATWLFLRGNRIWASLALSPIFITRYETLALAPIFLIIAWLDARKSGPRSFTILKMALLMLWAPVAYLIVAAALALPEAASPFSMFHRHYGGLYGSGTWTHYLSGFVLYFAGGGIAAVALAGFFVVGRAGRLVTLLVGGLVAIHTIIYLRGMFESGGYMRFLVPIAGLVGALAATGLAAMAQLRRLPTLAAGVALMAFLYWLQKLHGDIMPPWLGLDRFNWPVALLAVPTAISAVARKYSWRKASTGILLSAGLAAAVSLLALIRPLNFSRDNTHLLADEAVGALKADFAARPGLARHVLVPYIRPETKFTSDSRQAIESWLSSKPGTLFFWDNRYCTDAELQASLREHGKMIWGKTLKEARLEVYERQY